MIRCLQKVKAYDLLNYSPFSIVHQYLQLQWSPTLEKNVTGALIVETPMEMLRTGQMLHVPWMTGLTGDEGLFVTTGLLFKFHVHLNNSQGIFIKEIKNSS